MSFPQNISTAEIEVLDVANFEGPIVVVKEQDEDYAEAMEYLLNQEVIGFDTETKPCFHANQPRNGVALLQLSGEDRVYLFKLHSLGLPPTLIKILSSASILKVGAAVHDDIKGLQCYKRFIPGGFVDLQKIVDRYGIEEKSVRKLAAIILGRRVSKSQQLSNWEAPQLSGAQIKYAAIDAWVCREMYISLYNEDCDKCSLNWNG